MDRPGKDRIYHALVLPDISFHHSSIMVAAFVLRQQEYVACILTIDMRVSAYIFPHLGLVVVGASVFHGFGIRGVETVHASTKFGRYRPRPILKVVGHCHQPRAQVRSDCSSYPACEPF